MRINHNITALNTYNKLSSNQAATSKSLEKLSSGLKINKAGDNAAGLAISEKMRGQIRGLDQASTNANDAISLINTAEGALSETHSILQRMRELAVQSANDSNVTIDRDEIQKEMNQLTSEINRIGNTTEFNTQKLLNGGGTVEELKITTINAGAGQGEVAGVKSGASTFNISQINVSTSGTAKEFENTFTEVTNSGSATLTFQGVTLTINAVAGSGGAVASNTTATSATITLGAAGGSSGSIIATAVANALNSIKTVGGSDSKLADFTFAATGADLSATAGTTGDQYNTATLAVSSGGTNIGGTAGAGTAGINESRGAYAFTIDSAIQKEGATITISGVEFAAVAGNATGTNFNVGTDAKEQAASLAKAMNSSTLSVRFEAIVNGNTITLREKAEQATGTALATGSIAGNTAVAGQYAFDVEKSVAVGGKYEVDGVKIEVTDDASHAGLTNGTAVLYDADAAAQATKLVTAITSNATLGQKYTVSPASNKTITLTQKDTHQSMTGTEVATGTSAKDGFEANFQIGANTAQSLTVEVKDMRSLALGIAGEKEAGKAISKNGAEASFTATKNITDGTTNTGVEYALDVSTHEKATAAISVINDAIESVSAERSKLGSYQNRLEHTINNLGTSSENLTSAESRIRDVDMAKEMMEFTKNNILSQAAQSMLAQANQQPQGVLQLLQ